MQSLPVDNAGDSRLRFLFSDAVVSRNLAQDATFEDIARKLEELGLRHCGHPIAIDVTLAVPRILSRG